MKINFTFLNTGTVLNKRRVSWIGKTNMHGSGRPHNSDSSSAILVCSFSLAPPLGEYVQP